MALIMPSQDKHSGPADDHKGGSGEFKRGGAGRGRRQPKARMEATTSLNVACLKRLLPIGLNMFGGREQELVQIAKQRLIDVCEPANVENVLIIYIYCFLFVYRM